MTEEATRTVTLVVERDREGYKAFLQDNRSLWENSKTPEDALGLLILNLQAHFPSYRVGSVVYGTGVKSTIGFNTAVTVSLLAELSKGNTPLPTDLIQTMSHLHGLRPEFFTRLDVPNEGDVTIVIEQTPGSQRPYKAFDRERPAEREYGEYDSAAMGNLLASLARDFGLPLRIVGIERR